MLPPENQLIACMPLEERRTLLNSCETVQLRVGEVLSTGDAPVVHVYFPIEAFVSMVTLLEGKPCLEVAMIGREGMIGSQLALGVAREPLHAVVQAAGSSWRIGKEPFMAEVARNLVLRDIVLRYLYVTLVQSAVSSACLRFHHVGPRLARWLLMMQDRTTSDDFYVTHAVLAFLLGVRRVGITQAAALLQRQGLITYQRGNITILNRRGLMEAACSCYVADSKAYQDIFAAAGAQTV